MFTKNAHTLRMALTLMTIMSFSVATSSAQPSLGNLPDGSAVKGTAGNFVFGDHTLWLHGPTGFREFWTPPPGTTIASIYFKSPPYPGGPFTLFILLSDGSTYMTSADGDIFGYYWSIPQKRGRLSAGGTDTDPSKRFVADDLYDLKFYVWVSRDDGVTWKIDSAGSSNATVRDIALDTSGNVYAPTFSNGLFKQGKTDSVWKKNTTLVPTNLFSTYLDRKNRIFVSTTSSGITMSTDEGVSWNPNTSGMGNRQVSTFCDDAAGNIFAITDAGTRLYRSMAGTQAWAQIDAGIKSMAVDTTSKLFNDIGNDTTLNLATAFGLFTSTDQGGTWTHILQGLNSSGAYSFVKRPTGRIIIGTDLGIHYRNNSSSIWTKATPASGFLKFSALQPDNQGNIFGFGGGLIYKSTDEGSSLSLDNSGLSSFDRNGIYYIDETGAQHFVNTKFSSTIAYVRNGSAWVSDVAGITTTGVDQVYAIQSDKMGSLFLAANIIGKARVWRRPIAGGSWSADTVGIGTSALLALARYTNGEMLGSTGKLYRRTNGAWKQLTAPASVSSSTAYLISVDSSGAIYAAYYTYVSLQQVWKGVYVSKDTGATWQYAGLDSMEIRSLVSYGDSTYALTRAGISILSTSVTVPSHISPANAVTGISTDTILVWTPAIGAVSYQVQVATSVGFNPTFLDKSGITASSVQVKGLSGSTPYYWLVRSTGPGGTSNFSAPWSFTTKSTTGVSDQETLPTEFALLQNYPNPFNPSTMISYQLPVNEHVTLTMYDVLGREVATLVNERKASGNYTVEWNAAGFSSGIYIYRLKAGSFVDVKKMLLLK